MSVELFDHTGDIGVRLTAASREELFGIAALALTDILTAADSVEVRETADLRVSAAGMDLLLLEFLSELLFRFDARGWLTRRADVTIDERGDALSLTAQVHGEPLDPERHGIKVLVKAVTYHGLEVRKGDDSWQATVVFDV
ncbi:MAG: archease [Acidobacteria bacterium]|nr:archease [Acidobacteriota bacterium]